MSYATPWTGQLDLGTYEVEFPSNVQIDGDIWNFVSWEDGSTNPVRRIELVSGMYSIMATYQLPAPPPPLKGFVDIHAFLDSQELITPYEVTEAMITGITPDTIELDIGTYTVKATHGTETKTQTVEVLSGQTIRVDFQFVPTPTPPIAISPLFPNLRSRLEGFPRVAQIYSRVDEIRIKRQE